MYKNGQTTHLTEREKLKICHLTAEGVHPGQIAQRINRDYNTVQYALQNDLLQSPEYIQKIQEYKKRISETLLKNAEKSADILSQKDLTQESASILSEISKEQLTAHNILMYPQNRPDGRGEAGVQNFIEAVNVVLLTSPTQPSPAVQESLQDVDKTEQIDNNVSKSGKGQTDEE